MNGMYTYQRRPKKHTDAYRYTQAWYIIIYTQSHGILRHIPNIYRIQAKHREQQKKEHGKWQWTNCDMCNICKYIWQLRQCYTFVAAFCFDSATHLDCWFSLSFGFFWIKIKMQVFYLDFYFKLFSKIKASFYYRFCLFFFNLLLVSRSKFVFFSLFLIC